MSKSSINLNSITNWNHPNIDLWKKECEFLNHLDPARVQIILDIDRGDFENVTITSDILLVTNFSQSPVNEPLVKFAQLHPDKQIIYLADIDIYDYPLPANVTFFKYRRSLVKFFLHINPPDTIMRVKSKIITKKFSSLSHLKKQSRALVTAALLTYAQDDSVISWHNVDSVPTHDQMIDSLKNHPKLSNLNWDFINSTLLVNNHELPQKDRINLYSINDAYETCLINCSNETLGLGWHSKDGVEYTHPGPFLTEKTWKPLFSGNILLSVGQPYIYNFLKNQYNLPINYSIDTSYDNIAGDIDRFLRLSELINTLSTVSLTDLIDQNIDNCELIQNILLDPDYLTQFKTFNQHQDQLILEKISQL